jgi:4-amino-4-deoxy-L-arabinose transferase-like glycosyltransferase
MMRRASPVLILISILLFDVWYRAHSFGPALREGLGLKLWPASIGASEPLDCDEAAYAYMGHRILRGDILYRDLTENKPPLGYWLYTLAVALGGYHELTIRVMPIPFVLATIALVWCIAQRLCGPIAASLASGLFAVLSTDPYLFGNGANLEHFINFFATAALALVLLAWDRGARRYLWASGASLAAAALVKQVALLHACVFLPAFVLRYVGAAGGQGRRARRALLDVVAFSLGIAVVVAVAAAVLLARGAGRAAYEDIFVYGRALATDTLPDPAAPSALLRWLTGNADPSGRLPWPFGSTDYLVWWGTASWPIWIVSAPALLYLALGSRATAQRRLVAAWTLSAWVQVALPSLYWQHYYLLPTCGVAISVAVCLGDLISQLRPGARPAGAMARNLAARLCATACAIALATALAATVWLEVRSYLAVPPEQLTSRYKGGRQWVVLREMGRALAQSATIWDHPRLYVWGWQSPLHFYSGLDSPTRHFFVDNLLRDQADRNHPLIQPRTEEIVSAMRAQRPELVFTGYPPFRALSALLRQGYLPSRMSAGLWVRRDDFGRFEARLSRKAAPSGDDRAGGRR